MPEEDRLDRFRYRFGLLPQAVRITWEASRGWTIASVVVLILQGLLPVATVYLTKLLVDSLVVVVERDATPDAISTLATWAIALGLSMLASQILGQIHGWIRGGQADHVEDFMVAKIHEKATQIDYSFYESPDYFDLLDRVRGESGTRPVAIVDNLGNLLRGSITFVAMAAVLLPYALWIPLVLIAGTLPALWLSMYHHRKHHVWWKDQTETRRTADYFDLLLTNAESAAEARIFDFGPVLRESWISLRTDLRTERINLERQHVIARLLAATFAMVSTAAVMVWMVIRAMAGQATLGDLALFYQAFNQGQGLMRELLSSVSSIYQNTLFLEHLFRFLDLEAMVSTPEDPVEAPARIMSGIRLEEVSFRYPETEKWVFEELNLAFPAGKTVALVGANGAGKSTLLKLLTRLYDPQAGRVLFDEVDIRRFDIKALRRLVSVLFQFPVQYYRSVAENISIGCPDEEPDMQRVQQAAVDAGIHRKISRLPYRYATPLGRWFSGGVELSGGEWLRVALARAFYREAPVIILDEPTSMLDSWSEAKWYQTFETHARDRVAIIITHRFSVARRADLIYVMDEGKVVESGSHDALMAQKGRYFESWSEQLIEEEEDLV